jgi:acetoin utilization deacetylase AcuC-like enzyme
MGNHTVIFRKNCPRFPDERDRLFQPSRLPASTKWAGHPECPERLDAIEDRLLATGVKDALDAREAPLAALGDIELAHDRMMVAALRGLSEELADDIRGGRRQAYAQIDPDTALNVHTWNAALRAAGAAMAATDAVMAGELENAFCAVRPPGHHACRSKAMGFCFFNNIAVAARYALERHGLKRVAIVDFDVHHGNGTEDILAGDDRVLMVGLFQHPLYPYSGTEPRRQHAQPAGAGLHQGHGRARDDRDARGCRGWRNSSPR